MQIEQTTNDHGTPMTRVTVGSDTFTITPATTDRDKIERYARTHHMTAGQAGDAIASLPDC